MYVLGLTTLGNAAAALICDSQIVAAAGKERFSRLKYHSGFPYLAIQYCLNEAGITVADVVHVEQTYSAKAQAPRVYEIFRGLVNHAPELVGAETSTTLVDLQS